MNEPGEATKSKKKISLGPGGTITRNEEDSPSNIIMIPNNSIHFPYLRFLKGHEKYIKLEN